MSIEEHWSMTEPVEKLEEIPLDDSRPDQTTRIGTLASPAIRQTLTAFLKENQDVFAWSHEDMPGIDPSVMMHRLNVSPSFPPIRQKKRVFAPERDQAIAEEVRKLQEIGRNVQVYIDDMLVKSRREEDHLEDLRETFNTLCSYNMKLNPGKCAFRVTAGKFLGFMVSQRGIEANPNKIRAIIEMTPPKNVKEVQSLNGKIAALNRFVSRATDKCLPFFRTLNRSFKWTTECQQAFEELKAYLSSPPLLSPSQPGEELFLYLAVSPAAVNAALIREEEKVQKPVYYTSRALRGAEERYPPMEKLAFTLVTAARKLKPYFQAHTMIVLTDKPLRRAMSNPEAAGRLALWAIELSEFDIQYRPRTAVKGQVVADFIAEFTNGEDRGAEESLQWSIHVDGSSNRQAGGAGVVLQSPEGDTVECMVRLEFPTTNNEVKYKALIAGLGLVKAAGAERVIVYCDSQVIVNQISGEYECKGERMKKYLDQAKRRMNELKVKIIQIPRGENEQADRLAKAASAEHMATISNTLSFTQLSPLINAVDVQELGPKNDWTTPLTSFLKNDILPNEKEAVRKLKVQAARFMLIRDVLYKRGFSRPYLRCLGPEEADYVMREVHEGICGNHSGSRLLVHKLVQTGFDIPRILVLDNGKQFDNDSFRDFCS
nr:uncharacterized protein LOC112012361 [Quercus suber]